MDFKVLRRVSKQEYISITTFVFAFRTFSLVPKELEVAGVSFSMCSNSAGTEMVFLAQSLVFNSSTFNLLLL